MKNEGFDQLAYARRIRSAGRLIYIPEDDGEARSIPSDALRVRQTGGIIESAAFDWVPALDSMIPAFVVIFDQSARPYRAPVEL